MNATNIETLDFRHYVQRVKNANLHPKTSAHLDMIASDSLKNINHIIFYGPPGVGKYSQALNFISNYSPKELKYSKKITINCDINAKSHTLKTKISDIHYEIDMALLGCMSKHLWFATYSHIVDVILTKSHKTGIILCRNFHLIHPELLDIFYSYMQTLEHKNINLTYIDIS